MAGIFDTGIFDAGIFDYPTFLNTPNDLASFAAAVQPQSVARAAQLQSLASAVQLSSTVTTNLPSNNAIAVLSYDNNS